MNDSPKNGSRTDGVSGIHEADVIPPERPRSRGVMPVPAKVERLVRQHCESFFCDADGQIVIGQRPNLPLYIFFGAIAGVVVTSFVLAPLRVYFVIAALLSIVWWAVWEIVDGVCPWRRMIGFIGYNIALVVAVRYFDVI